MDSAIYNATGKEQLFDERKKIGILEPGEVAITPALNLDAKYIIHASGSWWDGGKHDEVQLLTNTIVTNVTLVQPFYIEKGPIDRSELTATNYVM